VRFFFSGEIDAEVADEFREVRQAVERALHNALGRESYGNALESIGVIPMILGPRSLDRRKERRLVQRAKKSADYRLIIDYAAWCKGSRDDRVQLLVRNLLEAVDDIDRKLKGALDGKQLRQDILKTFASTNP
jgi:hypothetical protein